MRLRVLLVDNHRPWRRHVSSALQNSLRWQVVGEASDGLEAVQKATALQPDLILLDIGLPEQSGIQAARQIRELASRSKILFLSALRSWDVAEVALCSGAHGYVVKSDAALELLPALEAISTNRRFVSSSLGGRRLEGAAPEGVPFGGRHHEAAFHTDATALENGYVRFAEAALRSGVPCIMVARASRQTSVCGKLREHGIDSDRAIREGKLFLLGVAEALAQFMVRNQVDETRFWNAATVLLMGAARASTSEYPRVAVCGEWASALWREGNGHGAIRVEQLWNDVARTYQIDLFCGYLLPETHNQDVDVYKRICAEHSVVESP